MVWRIERVWAKTLTRRDFFKLTGLTGAAAVLAACAPGNSPSAASGAAVGSAAGTPRKIGGTMNLVAWAGYDDPKLLADFKALYDVDVNVKLHSGDEELTAILSAAKPGDYDVAVPDTPWIAIFQKDGWLAELDPADFPQDDYYTRFKDFDQTSVDGKLYGIVTRWGYYGVIYNTDHVTPEQADTSEVMYDPQYKKKVVLFDWYLPNMGMIGRLLGLEQPYDATGTDLDKIKQKLFALRPQVAAIQPTPNDTITAMANETGWLSFGGEWQQALLKEQGNPIDVKAPKEGGVSWTEGAVILKDAANAEAAKAYLQYITSPQGAAQLAWAEAFHATVPNQRAVEHLQPDQIEVLRMGDSAAIDALLDNVATRKIPPDEKAWQDIWDEFKAMSG
jgi:spermidine/putrescine transport system substrate-binding protein